MSNNNSTAGAPSPKKENALLNLGFNIAIPAILLMKGAQWFGFTPTITLCIALLFPLSYGLFDLITRKKYNFFSILGIISIALTGGIGLLKLPKEWIALKEAAVPLVLGAAVLGSLKTRYPLVRTLLYNDQIINTSKVNKALASNNQHQALDKLLTRATWLIAASFLLSAALNFSLAKYFIQSETGTEAFTLELGKLTAWSYPIIALPCTLVIIFTLWQLLAGLEKVTGLSLEEIFVAPENKKKLKQANN